MYTKKLITHLQQNNIAVIPTDTLYGLVGRAENSDVIDRLYDIKGRDDDKPFVILIDSIDRLADFGIKLSSYQHRVAEKYWPNPITFIFDISDDDMWRLHYLHRGKKSLAFRIPRDEELRELIAQTGPLVAPSANTQGNSPAETIAQVQSYFGDSNTIMYVDGGAISGRASTIVKLGEDKGTVLRVGRISFSD